MRRLGNPYFGRAFLRLSSVAAALAVIPSLAFAQSLAAQCGGGRHGGVGPTVIVSAQGEVAVSCQGHMGPSFATEGDGKIRAGAMSAADLRALNADLDGVGFDRIGARLARKGVKDGAFCVLQRRKGASVASVRMDGHADDGELRRKADVISSVIGKMETAAGLGGRRRSGPCAR